MSLGLEQALAEFLNAPPSPAPSFGGLYSDADAANRVIWIGQQPPVPVDDTAVAGAPSDYETTAALAITVFIDGGEPPQLLLGEVTTITIQCRHPSYETAMQTQRAIFELLQENGGQGNGANPLARGVFRGIRIYRITADFPPLPLGRDQQSEGGRFITTQSFTVRSKPVAFS